MESHTCFLCREEERQKEQKAREQTQQQQVNSAGETSQQIVFKLLMYKTKEACFIS